MLLYPALYRLKGVRRNDKIVSPPLSLLKEFELPLHSMVHYTTDGVDLGPTPAFALLQGSNKGCWVDHALTLATTEGNPRYVPAGILTDVRAYIRANPTMRRLLKPYESVRDGKYPLVVNYALLNRSYVYRNGIYARFYEWANVFNTVCQHVNKGAVVERQQFVLVNLPDHIPTIEQFKHAADRFDATALRIFNTPELWTLLDIWKWLGKARGESSLGTITTEGLDHLNIVWLRNGKITIQNLGLLNSWRYDSDDLTAEKTAFSIDYDKLQKRYLRFWITMTDIEAESELISDDEFLDAAKPGLVASSSKTIKLDESASGDDQYLDAESPTMVETDDHIGGNDQIDADTDEMLAIHDQQLAEPTDATVVDLSDIEPYQPVNITLDHGIDVKARKALESGSITLAEAHRFQALGAKHREIIIPGTTQPISEYMRVTSEMTVIKESPQLPDIESVTDKSMLNSTLLEMDPRYIRDVLPRDIAGAIMGLQQAGIAVTKVDMVEHQDISSHYRTYVVELHPVNGKQSTVRIKVPVVKEDGTVLSGGVKYYLKKQRAEMPIRKVSPSRVALTSYYGKVFVDRSQNVSVNYDHWLGNQITVLGLDRESDTVTDMRVGSSFDSSIHVARTYTALAKRFTSFTAAGIQFNFNYEKRYEINNCKPAVESYHLSTVVGKMGSATVVMETNGNMIAVDYLPNVKGPSFTQLGTIEELLGLPQHKCPIEMATMTVFSENIPLGIVLGYRLGLSKLIRSLGVTPRRVEAGKQLNLAPDEFRIRFKDQSLIFSRKNARAAMILSGLNARHRSIARYDLAMFDRPDVYFNILDEAGLGVRFTRELDVMFDLFIDNITRELLETMNEPTDMTLLVLRAVELLSTDYFKEEDGVREKGYERIAGAVYNQLIRAYRAKQAKPFSNRAGVELNPEAVWLTIMMDSAMEVVSDINPIHNLKNKEVVTFGGTGGRSTKTMVKRTRAFRPNDLGVISEATVDSGDVGIITYLSADPKYVSLRGIRGTYDFDTEGKTRLLSTSVLMAPSADNDDQIDICINMK